MLRHASRAADSFGWFYTLAACGDVLPPPAACAAAPRSAVLQEAGGPCYGLGTSASRRVAATAAGLSVAFSGGDGNRSTLVAVECADVPRPQVVRWSHGATPTTYAALVRARAGCALECARSEVTGAVCGGSVRGACKTPAPSAAARCSQRVRAAAARSGARCTW